MARIPVQRKAGPAWIMAGIAIVIVAVGIWVFIARWGNANVSASPPSTPPQVPHTLYNQRLLDLDAVLKYPDQESLVGMRAELPDVRIQSVPAGHLFWIGTPLKKILVAPNKPDTPASAIEPGNIVAISGTFERMPDAQRIRQRWGVSAEAAQELSRQKIYLEADNIQPEPPGPPPAR